MCTLFSLAQLDIICSISKCITENHNLYKYSTTFSKKNIYDNISQIKRFVMLIKVNYDYDNIKF